MKILKLLLCCIFIIEFSFTSFANPTESAKYYELENIKVTKLSSKKVKIAVDLTGPVTYNYFKISKPDRLVLEMNNALYNFKEKEIVVSNSFISKVRSGQYKDKPIKISRVVIDLKSPVSYNISHKDNKIILVLQKETVPVLGISSNIEDLQHKKLFERIKKSKTKVTVEVPEKKLPIKVGEIVTSLSKEKVNFDFVGTSLSDVIRAFSEFIDRNIILDEDIVDTITIHLHNIPFDEAFNIVLEQKGLVAIQSSENVIKVLDKTKLPTIRRTFNLKNRKAEDVKKTIESVLTSIEKSYTIIASADVTNSIIVSSTPEAMKKIETLINELDVKAPQIKITSRIIEVNVGNTTDLGIEWGISKNFTAETANDSNIKIRTEQQTINTPETSEKVSESKVSATESLGIPSPYSLASLSKLNIATVLSGADLNVILSAIAQKTKSRTLSRPTILVENNKSAHIHVGDTIPYTTQTVTETGTTTEMKTLEIGTTLDVTPAVSPGSEEITLDISVNLKELVAMLDIGPQTSDRSASTKITVKNGQTVVIGGLISEKKHKTVYQVPILGSIPIIGYLFKKEEESKTRTELLIFLTPKIVTD